MNLLATDVSYIHDKAIAAGVLFHDWKDEKAEVIKKTMGKVTHKYIPGQLYLRELPCILGLLEKFNMVLDIILIDGYVRFDKNNPGLGMHLYNRINGITPIIGIAKNKYKHETIGIPVFRGNSKRPLIITSIGMDEKNAATAISEMHGPYKIPTMIKLADRESKSLCMK
ncbi:endonuclease V [bacterium]|nr:endonuclease V [bacterium]RQV99322.1 MAG: endonuclease V [bacterium]